MNNPIEPISEAQTDIEYRDPRAICTHEFAATPSKPAHRCGSPALRGETFCYYHHPARRHVRNPNERHARRTARQSFNLPFPTTQQGLQFTVSEIMQRLAANQIDTRRAGLLLFALQIAGRNLPALAQTPAGALRLNNFPSKIAST